MSAAPDWHDSLSFDSEVDFFKALGDETRLRIVALLCHGELCVCHLVSALGLPQSTVSRQLTVLRKSSVVRSRREGLWVHYSLAPQKHELVREQLRLLETTFKKNVQLRDDVERLLATRGPGQCSPT
jgi:ArsR family transcriptional regulator